MACHTGIRSLCGGSEIKRLGVFPSNSFKSMELTSHQPAGERREHNPLLRQSTVRVCLENSEHEVNARSLGSKDLSCQVMLNRFVYVGSNTV